MGRVTYVYATCSELFTRKYSATRHNTSIHDNRGEIVPLLEYLAGRKSGRYQPSHPSLYRMRRSEKRSHNFGHATTTVAADSMGDTFRHRGLQGQYHHYPQQLALSPSISLPSLPSPSTQDVSPSQPMTTTNDQGIISQETILKIQELKRLMYKYPQYHSNPDAFVICATFYSINGDNTLLDEWLVKLRNIDAISKY
jgi:hypothetical protein